MFKPHVTVACVVHAAGKFLVVEETINGKALWNQPAGHLEADETLVQAAERELWEETGIRATPQAFLRLHQWIAPDRTAFLLRYRAGTAAADRAARQRHRSLPVAERRRDFAGAQPAFRAGGGEHSQLPAAGALSAVAGRQLRLAVLRAPSSTR